MEKNGKIYLLFKTTDIERTTEKATLFNIEKTPYSFWHPSSMVYEVNKKDPENNGLKVLFFEDWSIKLIKKTVKASGEEERQEKEFSMEGVISSLGDKLTIISRESKEVPTPPTKKELTAEENENFL